jgi:hypothetical protein
MAKQPNRSINTQQDISAMDAIQHNDPVGAKKVIVVQPTVARATAALEPVGAGKLILIAATSYNLVMTGRDYDSSKTYMKGDVVANGTSVYIANEDNITGAFDASLWIKKADKTISAIPCVNPSVVSTGRWHNSISVAGFLVDDDSAIEYTRIRD